MGDVSSVGDQAGSAVTAQSSGVSVTAQSSGESLDSEVPAVSRPVTRLQHGISKPKIYTDGTVRWCNQVVINPEEPVSIVEAMNDPKWAAAMDSEHQALLRNKTWRLVPRP